MSADIIDLLAGIGPASPLAAVRDQRPQARENAQRSFRALLEPTDDRGLTLVERYAVAAFVAQLHGFAEASAFYRDLLADEAPALVDRIAAAASAAAARGPYGQYREPRLQSEGVDGLRWRADPALGARLAAALTHAHLLVFRPREARAEHLQALVDAGLTPDQIVSLSQLVAFLSFQLRTAWGLRALAASPASASPPASDSLAVTAGGA